MKKANYLLTLFILSVVFTACSDDDSTPLPVNEEEVITTVTVTLTPTDGGDVVTLQMTDLDGEGGNDPVYSDPGVLTSGTAYTGTIELLNEAEEDPENITLEVLEEAEEHQFIYTVGGNLDVSLGYGDFDNNGDPLGVTFNLSSGTASTGTLTFTLRHEPTKPNDNTLDGAGGETDVEATFEISVQ